MSKITDAEIYDELESFAIKIDDKEDVIYRMRDICETHSLSAGDLICELVALKSTKKIHVEKVTAEFLDQLDRELCKKSKKHGVSSKLSSSSQYNKPSTSFNTSVLTSDTEMYLERNDEKDGEDALLNSYCTPNGKSNKRPCSTSLLSNGRSTKKDVLGNIPDSPQVFSPICLTPSIKYSSRANKGEVVCNLGETSSVSDWGQPMNETDRVTVSSYDVSSELSADYNYMVQRTSNVSAILDDMIEDMGQLYKDAGLIEYFSNLVVPVQDTVPVIGRICCDSNGRLNARSVLLEGSLDRSNGRSISLDLSNLSQYSLFPGQIVVVEGANTTGAAFKASRILDGLYLAKPPKPVLHNDLIIVAAAGPFTTSDNLSYDPLNDLLEYLSSSPPHVCILLGPFVDAKHTQIEECKFEMTYEALFNAKLRPIIDVTQKFNIELVIIPSQRDANHEPIYPQPPFVLTNKHSIPTGVHMMSDPCTLNINGLVVGVTTTDVLFHLGPEEISLSKAGSTDRISRLLQNILTQHTYYPLYPPNEELNVDYEQFDLHAHLPVTPHVLLVPSDLRYFTKVVEDTACINPGHLAKGQAGGTFARLVVKPVQSESDFVCKSIACEVLRI